MRHLAHILAAMAMLLGGAAAAQATDAERVALREWRAGEAVSEAAVSEFGEARCFRADTLSDAVFQRMRGKSYKAGCTVPRRNLRYVRALHRDAEGRVRLGEMVCNKQIANDLVDIFRELYHAGYPIERMVLIDCYDADDERSMADNNSSCFNFRQKTTSAQLSKHALGLAVDINTRYNPYVLRRRNGTLYVAPSNGRAYANRARSFPYKIVRGDLCHQLFLRHGFKWGGAWKRSKDYQHFEK